jgi:hypothetical protein
VQDGKLVESVEGADPTKLSERFAAVFDASGTTPPSSSAETAAPQAQNSQSTSIIAAVCQFSFAYAFIAACFTLFVF